MKLQVLLFVLLLVLTNSFISAQNVGIGTTTPANKLSVNGNADFTGNVGIGTTAPTGEFNVKSLYTGSEYLDVEILFSNLVYGAANGSDPATLDQWQSFTADTTGLLSKVALRIKSPLGNVASSGIIKIYQGEGTSGTLLATVSVTMAVAANQFQNFDMPDIPVTDGSKYTVRFTVPAVTAHWIYVSTTNPYSGGHAGHDINENNPAANCDVNIRTFLKATANIDALVADNGNVMIGSTSNNSARLRIDADNSALPALSISGKGEVQVDTFGTVGGRFIIKNNGNVGINTANPATKLDVNGGIRTKYSGTTVISVPIAGIAIPLNITIPELPAGWDFMNTYVSVTNVDGPAGFIKQAKITSSTNIAIIYIADAAAQARFNWIIFKL
ncbi:MAG TPA: hypothetical protein VFG10_07140 [Saprospiraceae bacterium]|nr:hypothetical protein [Saprospiraceae bacterium]